MTENQTNIDYVSEIEQLNNRITELNSEIENLSNERTSMQNAIDTLNVRNGELTNEISHLKSVNYDLFMRGYTSEKVESNNGADIDEYTDLATLLNDIE